MIFLAIGLLVVGLVLYLLTGEGDMIAGVARDDFPQLMAVLAIIIFLMAGAARWTRGQVAQAIGAFGAWVAVGLVFVALYAYRAEIGEVRDRVVQELQPGSVQTVTPGTPNGKGAVIRVRKGGDGHFTARTRVNGQSVAMIVDTGASTVVLKPDDARRAGIRLNELSYTIPVDTANGRGFAARVKLARVALGELVVENVDALVTRPGALQQSLLGMSFLSRLKSYEFSGNQLVMRS
jgi:aspartyl protease family protein